MEVNSEKGFAKYSRFDNGKKDNETSLILSTESHKNSEKDNSQIGDEVILLRFEILFEINN